MDAPIDLLSLSEPELADLLKTWGEPSFRAKQVREWVYQKGATHFEAMTNLPKPLRERLAEATTLGTLTVDAEQVAQDGTVKRLYRLSDGQLVESVLMAYEDGRRTACISSQAGCAMGCVFCATGQMGFVRHLSAGEIVAQAMHVDAVLRGTGPDAALADAASASPHDRHERLRNLVLMGMGEPLHNYDAVMQAIDILRDPNGLALGAKKITLSTVGVVPGILRLAAEQRPVHLAVSLHGATQEERAALVPAARKWPLDELMDACRAYIARQQRRIFYEWTLIEGKNDTPETAHAVGRLLHGQLAQVNLIPLNPTAGYDGEPTGRDAAKKFQAILAGYGLPSTIRQRRGIDIAAGCGQLAVAKK